MSFIPLHFDQLSFTLSSYVEFMVLVDVTELCTYVLPVLSMHVEFINNCVFGAIVRFVIMFVYSWFSRKLCLWVHIDIMKPYEEIP